MRRTHPITPESFDLYVANIKACYYQSCQYAPILEAGLNWYPAARSEGIKLANRYKIGLKSAIGVIAALSPNNKWERNLVDADLLLRAIANGKKLDQFKVATFNQNKYKAYAIAHGADPLDQLGGNKVRTFYQCILDPSDAYTVCIDGHAIHVALGKLASLNKAPALSDPKFELLAEAYRQATREINQDSLEGEILPLQCQAVTWAYYRVIKGVDTNLSI